MVFFSNIRKKRIVWEKRKREKAVRLTGLEPARRETLDPKSNASTNSATGACCIPLCNTDHKRDKRVQNYCFLLKQPNYSVKSFRARSIIRSTPCIVASSESATLTSGSMPNSVCWR